MKFARFCLLVLTTVALSSCIRTHSYLDPALHDLSWSAIHAPAQKYSVVVTTEFYRNGERAAGVDKEAQGAVERAIDHSGVLVRATGAPVTMKVTINNLANLGEAFGKGFGTGLTFGAAGSTVTDGYAVTIVYTQDGQTSTKLYKHAIHTTIGNAAPVTSATPMALALAFDQVVDDAIMHFIRDMQDEGKLVLRGLPRANPFATNTVARNKAWSVEQILNQAVATIGAGQSQP